MSESLFYFPGSYHCTFWCGRGIRSWCRDLGPKGVVAARLGVKPGTSYLGPVIPSRETGSHAPGNSLGSATV